MSLVPTFRDLDEALRARGATSPLADEAVREALARHTRAGGTTPWFVTLLSGVGAWLASLCFFAFLACAGVLESEEALLGLGLASYVFGLALRRLDAGIFVEQVGLALVMLGPIAVGAAVEALSGRSTTTATCVLALSIVALATVPDAVVAFLFTVALAASASYLAMHTRAAWADEATSAVAIAVVHALFAQGGRGLPRRLGALYVPVTNGLFLSALALLVFRAFGQRLTLSATSAHTGALDVSLLVVLTALSIASSLVAVRASDGARRAEVAGLTVGFFVTLALLTYRMPELVCVTGLVVLSFHRRRPLLAALAGAMTMLAVALYYYDLSLTLLEKSIAMFAAGVVFLVAYKVVAWRFPSAHTSEVPS